MKGGKKEDVSTGRRVNGDPFEGLIYMSTKGNFTFSIPFMTVAGLKRMLVKNLTMIWEISAGEMPNYFGHSPAQEQGIIMKNQVFTILI